VDTESLRWFQHVADGTTVTEVADSFGVSQPGVSRALNRLDAELGTPLLERSGRVLRLTEAGATFKRHVDTLLHELDDGLAAIDQLVDPETGTVTIAFQLSLGTWLIPAIVSQFRARHPGVVLRFQHSVDGRSSTLRAGSRVDVEFTSRHPTDPAIRWEPMMSEELLLAVPPHHRLAADEEISLAEASAEPFIALGRSWELRRLSDELCQVAGFTPRIAFEGNDLPMVHGFVGAGLGVAIVPRMGMDPRKGRKREARLLRLTDPGAFRAIGVSWSSERRLLPSAELFRRFVLRRSLSAGPRTGPTARPTTVR
jgi:LysR family transcriptional regulator, transcription activator of glutamate synthase operon